MNDRYENPLCKRYASKEMQEIFSDDRKFSTWRKLWVILAESEKELGLDITDEQLDEMRAHLYDIDYETARRREAEVRHDVMAHIYTYGLACHRPLFDKLISNVKEVKARGAQVLAVAQESERRIFAEADQVLLVPECDALLLPIPEIVPLQLFAYYVAKANGCDIDKPKNLAKSVTVE